MQIFSLGDTAITIDLGNVISADLNEKVLAMEKWLQQHSFEGMKELVVAYSSLTVYYDPFIIRKKYQPATLISHWVNEKLQEAFRQSSIQESNSAKIHRIPVCYEEEFGIDLVQMTTRKKISIEKIIEWHTSKLYRVYMLGFMPGFPYMGEVDEQLATPRKQKPVIVEAGSVGIAGTQTGIYPFKSPGGWNIIGRTPVSLFNKNEHPCVWLQPGDQVQFYSIIRAEFEMQNAKSKI